MRYMAPMLALLLSSCAQAQEATPLKGSLNQLAKIQAIGNLSGSYLAACESRDAADFIQESFSKGAVRGWIATSIISRDMRDVYSQERSSLGVCRLDTYRSALNRLPLEMMAEPDPELAERFYLVLPPMPATFKEHTRHEESDDDYYFDSDSKG